jgi:hypothetical protein
MINEKPLDSGRNKYWYVLVFLLDVTRTLLIGVHDGAAPLGWDITASLTSPST